VIRMLFTPIESATAPGPSLSLSLSLPPHRKRTVNCALSVEASRKASAKFSAKSESDPVKKELNASDMHACVVTVTFAQTTYRGREKGD
jgi:hypothetical protein